MIVCARFICAIVLHMSLQEELKNGLMMMKFSLNHDFRFSNYKVAFLAGFLQTTILCIVELVNMLCILTASSMLDVVMNFMALAVIAEFDDTFYAALGNDDNKNILSGHAIFQHLFTITKTSSIDAQATNRKNWIIDETHPKVLAQPED